MFKTDPSRKLGYVDVLAIIDAQPVYRKEQEQWHESMKAFDNDIEPRAAWSAGYSDGWRDCINFLKLNGYIKVTDGR